MKKFWIILLFLLCVCTAEALPSRYDLRDDGRITSVKNQGIPGPCWAFACVAAMESNSLTQNLNANSKMPDLSEMHLAVFCFKNPIQEYNFTSEKKSGILSNYGNAFRAVALLSRLAGPVNESSLRYNNNMKYSDKKNLLKKLPEDFKRSLRLRDAYFLGGDIDPGVSVRKDLIMKHGAIVVNMYSDPDKYHTKGKFYTYFNNEHRGEVNHVVAIAGWNDDFSRENFSPKPKNNGAWLVKNSWGTSRGTNAGYFWMSYEQESFGGTAFIVEKNNLKLKHYGYDALGWCNSYNYSWAANVFRVSDSNEQLIEVAFYTPSNNLAYEIYIYKNGKILPSSPVNGDLIITLKGKMEYVGYHTITLPEKILLDKDEYFSVVVKLARNEMPVECAIKNYSENAIVHQHESYFSFDGKKWTDGITVKANACIKAFTLK